MRSILYVDVGSFDVDPFLGQQFLVATGGDQVGVAKLPKVLVAFPEVVLVVSCLVACDLVENGKVCSVVVGAERLAYLLEQLHLVFGDAVVLGEFVKNGKGTV